MNKLLYALLIMPLVVHSGSDSSNEVREPRAKTLKALEKFNNCVRSSIGLPNGTIACSPDEKTIKILDSKRSNELLMDK